MTYTPDKEHEIEYLLTINEVAVHFRVTVQTVRKWLKAGKLQAYRIRKKDVTAPASEQATTIYFTKAALSRWAEIYYRLNEEVKK